MDAFVKLFAEIDVEKNDSISKKELEDYVKKNNLDPGMVNTWLTMFDKNKSGVITLDEFCKTLSISPADVQKQRSTLASSAPGGIPREIEVISTSISDVKKQSEIAHKAIQLTNTHAGKDLEQKLIANDLKVWLDKTYGRAWQVVIVNGSYFMNFSHDPENSFFFKHEKNIFLTWKTPSD